MRSDRPEKPTPRAARPVPVTCRLRDCIFFESDRASGADACLCTHPHKHLYLREASCPLYHFDWQRKFADSKTTK